MDACMHARCTLDKQNNPTSIDLNEFIDRIMCIQLSKINLCKSASIQLRTVSGSGCSENDNSSRKSIAVAWIESTMSDTANDVLKGLLLVSCPI